MHSGGMQGITLFCDTGHRQVLQSLIKLPSVLYKILFYLESQAYYQSLIAGHQKNNTLEKATYKALVKINTKLCLNLRNRF